MKLIVYHIHKKIKGFQADGVFGAFIKERSVPPFMPEIRMIKKDIKGEYAKLCIIGKVLYSRFVGQNVGDSQ